MNLVLKQEKSELILSNAFDQTSQAKIQELYCQNFSLVITNQAVKEVRIIYEKFHLINDQNCQLFSSKRNLIEFVLFFSLLVFILKFNALSHGVC